MLDLQGWYTLGVLSLMFVALLKEYVSADFVVFGALVGLWIGKVVSTEEALSGFHNPMTITIGMLFIVSAAMRETGALNMITRRLLAQEASPAALPRLLYPTAALSSFMNNTPIVAMLTPAVRSWAARQGQPPSKFLIPLSYAAILGGTCTLIGTSTNLAVSGMISDRGMEPFGMFELSPVGLPATVIGLTFMSLVGHRLLPARQTPDMASGARDREYSVVLEVEEDCELIGQTVKEAGLRQLSGLFLAEIVRGNRRIVPVRPTNRIRAGDRLVLFGVVDTVVDLRRTPGLRAIDEEDQAATHGGASERNLYEVVVSAESPLVGKNLRDAGFRRRYDAAVIAIHRGGHRLNQKLGDVELRPGDTLMAEASPGFRRTWANSTHFYLVSQVEEGERPRFALSNFAAFVLITMVVLITTGTLPIAQATAGAAVLLVWFRCIRPAEARRSVNLSVLLIIASAFGIAAAVTNSGLADALGGLLVDTVGGARPWVALAAIYIATAVATEALSNVAAAALIVPIALSAAEQLGRDPRPFAVAVAIAASMSFITPIGYQTNLLVYGPGGYRFSDFMRVGFPMAVIAFVVSMVVIPWRWGWG
jgi:di/tricarboxylate transporter